MGEEAVQSPYDALNGGLAWILEKRRIKMRLMG